ncbi:MAG: iron ABC transporter permease [Pleurocapsa sp. SU_196_0]|nr:iron ABC transporter permease [Pleurocapsa sp. SU_196_0]
MMNSAQSSPRTVPLERGSAVPGFIALIVLLLVVLGFGLALGSYPISVQTLMNWFAGRADPTAAQILSDVRGPRVLLAFVVGVALGLTGPLLQAGFRTSLADSYLLGLAGFGALAAVLFQGMGLAGFGTPLLAILGAILAVWLVGQLSAERSSERRALIGVALAAMSLAGLSLLLALSQSPSSANVLGWIIGGFYALGVPQLQLMIPFALPAIVVALLVGRSANLLQLGDDVAQNLGLNARVARNGVLMLAAALTGAAVGSSGLMGFVGLLSVSVARTMFGTDYRRLLPASALDRRGVRQPRGCARTHPDRAERNPSGCVHNGHWRVVVGCPLEESDVNRDSGFGIRESRLEWNERRERVCNGLSTITHARQTIEHSSPSRGAP